MPDARQLILERIRSAVGHQPDDGDSAGSTSTAVSRTYIRAGLREFEARLDLFKERLHDYDARVTDASAASLADAISGVLSDCHQTKIITADGLPPGALPREFDILPEHDALIEDLSTCGAVITACSVAIAATGTIVLTHRPGEGARRLSLLPDRHLCVVNVGQIVETVPEAFERLAQFARGPLTFISGPSATADIEMIRVRGVHGPRFLDVILVR